jgi:hypothetical protein
MCVVKNALQGQRGTSLADCVERAAVFYSNAPKTVRKQIRQEIRDALSARQILAKDSALAARIGVQGGAERIFRALQEQGHSVYEHSCYLYDLGVLGKAPQSASEYIEGRFLSGRTMAAATFALMSLDPPRIKSPFGVYAKRNAFEGALVAGAGLVQNSRSGRWQKARECVNYIPGKILDEIPALYSLPEQLQKIIRLKRA